MSLGESSEKSFNTETEQNETKQKQHIVKPRGGSTSGVQWPLHVVKDQDPFAL